MTEYNQLAECLDAKGIGSYYQGPDRFVVSGLNPALPTANCFWVARRGDEWYIGTWLPAIYQVPLGQDICRVCEIVFRSSGVAIYTIDEGLASQLQLRRLTDQEIDLLGLA